MQQVASWSHFCHLRERNHNYGVDVGRRVCYERRRDETLLVKKDAKESAMDACGMESGRGFELPR